MREVPPPEAGRLREIGHLSDLDDAEAEWILSRVQSVRYDEGEVLFRPGSPADSMYVMLEGAVELRPGPDRTGPPRLVIRAGEISGMLPFSRMTRFSRLGVALAPTWVLRLGVEHFPALLARIPRLEARLVGILADRVREFTRLDQQQEKLLALGRLAAGLAHELNNPAAAARRAAAELTGRAVELGPRTAALVRDADAGLVEALERLRAEAVRPPADESPVDRSGREQALEAWLSAAGLPEPWIAAETLAAEGIDADGLAAALEGAAPEARRAAVAWLETAIAIGALARDAHDAAARISALVAAVKGYSRMDQPAVKEPVDIHQGLESTVAILGPRLRQQRIALERRYQPDLPRVPGLAGDLNQVWTNLLDNALDAVPDGGRIEICTRTDRGGVLVEIVDDGAGIPPELHRRIWEPFFTTKPVGQGTGLGLDIVRGIVEREHGGEVALSSRPGETRFGVWLPGASSDGGN